MIGVVVDDDIVAVPEPIVAVGDVEGRDTEVESAKPEAAGTATNQAPAMTRADAAFEVTMLPGMVEVEAGIVTSLIVAHPFAVVVYVRGLGVAFAIAKGLLGSSLMRCLMRRTVIGRGTVGGRVTATDLVASAVVAMLCPQGQGKNERDDKKFES